MTRAAISTSRRISADETGRPATPPTPSGYFRRSELPLTSLVFLLPLVIFYEVGTRAFVTDPIHQTEQRIIAFSLLQRFFQLFGASGRYLPGMAVVGVLLAWHIARRDLWSIRPAHIGWMAIESVMLAVPLIVLERATERYLHRIALIGSHAALSSAATKGLLVLSVGAGVYEELMFRLIAFTLLSFLFFDILELNKIFGSLLIVAVSAVLFAAYHYLGDEPFRWWTFAFRIIAGAYFGVVFLWRGFGVTAGCHAAYDLCVVALRIAG